MRVVLMATRRHDVDWMTSRAACQPMLHVSIARTPLQIFAKKAERPVARGWHIRRDDAAVRIVVLQAEIVEIQQMFPDLGGTAGTRKRPGRRAGKPAARSALAALMEPAAPRRKRRRLSAAARKAISDA
jgi:hypothetical protein